MNISSLRISNRIFSLGTSVPYHADAVVAVNAYVVHAEQPLLVDTGLKSTRDAFVMELSRIVDPADLRWVWLTGTDPDHVGNLRSILRLAPQARVVTNFVGMSKLALLDIPLERMHLLNVGEPLDLGDRQVVAMRPPAYPSPDSIGLFEPEARSLFTGDCFGALLRTPCATANELLDSELREGVITWSTMFFPWIQDFTPTRLQQMLENVRRAKPRFVLATHLPPADGMTELLLSCLLEARTAQPHTGPNQAEFVESLWQID